MLLRQGGTPSTPKPQYARSPARPDGAGHHHCMTVMVAMIMMAIIPPIMDLGRLRSSDADPIDFRRRVPMSHPGNQLVRAALRAAGFNAGNAFAVIVLIGIVAGIVVNRVGETSRRASGMPARRRCRPGHEDREFRLGQRRSAAEPQRPGQPSRQQPELEGTVRQGVRPEGPFGHAFGYKAPASTAISTSSSTAPTVRAGGDGSTPTSGNDTAGAGSGDRGCSADARRTPAVPAADSRSTRNGGGPRFWLILRDGRAQRPHSSGAGAPEVTLLEMLGRDRAVGDRADRGVHVGVQSLSSARIRAVSARDFVAALRYTRGRAIVKGAQKTFDVDLDAMTYSAPDKEPGSFPRASRVRVLTAAQGRRAPSASSASASFPTVPPPAATSASSPASASGASTWRNG